MAKEITRNQYEKALNTVYEYQDAFLKRDVLPSWKLFKSRRIKLNITIQDIVDNTGCSKSFIHRLEKGSEITYSTVKKIHDYYSLKEREEQAMVWSNDSSVLKYPIDVLYAVSFISKISIEDMKGTHNKRPKVNARAAYFKICDMLKQKVYTTEESITNVINKTHTLKRYHTQNNHKDINLLVSGVLEYYSIRD